MRMSESENRANTRFHCKTVISVGCFTKNHVRGGGWGKTVCLHEP